jgi:hypothetical protein
MIAQEKRIELRGDWDLEKIELLHRLPNLLACWDKVGRPTIRRPVAMQEGVFHFNALFRLAN